MSALNDVLSGRPMKIFVVAKKELRRPDHAKHEKPMSGGELRIAIVPSRNVDRASLTAAGK